MKEGRKKWIKKEYKNERRREGGQTAEEEKKERM